MIKKISKTRVRRKKTAKHSPKNNAPSEGERRAVSGYRYQYRISAYLILKALRKGDLKWIRVADPDAGRVDDFQLGSFRANRRLFK